MLQTPVRRGSNTEIVLEFAVYIAQRRRYGNAGQHRKTHPVRLMRFVIRILTEDHRLHTPRWRLPEGIEDQFGGRVYLSTCSQPLAQEARQRLHVVLCKFAAQQLEPIGMQLYRSFGHWVKVPIGCRFQFEEFGFKGNFTARPVFGAPAFPRILAHVSANLAAQIATIPALREGTHRA